VAKAKAAPKPKSAPKLTPFAKRNDKPKAAVTVVNHPERHNGIACPNCGGPMADVGGTMQTEPPTIRTECTNRRCGYMDTRRVA
jgi:hypothetical protein